MLIKIEDGWWIDPFELVNIFIDRKAERSHWQFKNISEHFQGTVEDGEKIEKILQTCFVSKDTNQG